MSTHRVITIILLNLFLLTVSALAGDDFVWRPVSPAELAMKEPLVEKDADAEAIFWEVRLDDKKTTELSYEHYVRVKIFTERGREKYSKFDIPIYKGKKVKDVAARVIKPDGTIVELKPEDVFEREIVKGENVKIRAVSFAVPGIEPGVIVEYRYREFFKGDSASGERLFFQRDIPLQKVSYYIRPFEGQNLQTESFNMPANLGFAKEKNGFFVASLTNVKAFKEEPRMPPDNQVRSWSLLFYDGFFSQHKWQNLALTYSMVVKDVIKPNGDVKKMSAELTSGAASSEDKLRKLYEFVQKEIKNIVFDTSMTTEQKEKIKNKTAGDTLKRRMGDSADIEILFASLATAAGFDARIVLSGDRSEFFFDPNQNLHRSFVHVACIGVNVDGSWRYYNPGTPFLPFGKLLWYEEAVAAILVGESNYQMGRTPLSEPDKNNTKRTGRFKLLEDGTLEGTFSVEYAGHNAINRRQAGYDDSEQKRLDNFKDEIKALISTAEISELTEQNFADNTKPIIYSGKIHVPSYAQKTGKRLFLQPGFFEYGAKPLFTSSTRIYPVYFHYPWSENDDIEIVLPPGFTLDNADSPGLLADSSKISMDDISIAITNDKKTLIYKRKFYFGNGGHILFPVEVYPAVKGLFDQFHKADSHTVTLKQN